MIFIDELKFFLYIKNNYFLRLHIDIKNTMYVNAFEFVYKIYERNIELKHFEKEIHF